MTISLRLSEADTTLFKKYAEMNGMTVSELVRRSVLEHIEDILRYRTKSVNKNLPSL